MCLHFKSQIKTKMDRVAGYKTKVRGIWAKMTSRTKLAASTPSAPNPMCPTLQDRIWLLVEYNREKRLLLRSNVDSERSGPQRVPRLDMDDILIRQWFHFQRGISMTPLHTLMAGAMFGRRWKIWGLELQSLSWESPSTHWFSPLTNSNYFTLTCK